MTAARLLPDTEWFPQGAGQFVDRRVRLTRDHGLVHQNVRAFRGVIARRKDGRQEFDRCPHAHQKPGSARQCAERAARRLNRQTAR